MDFWRSADESDYSSRWLGRLAFAIGIPECQLCAMKEQVEMDYFQSLQQVEGIGGGYFEDYVGEYTDEEIIGHIQQDIRLSQLRGMADWEITRDAFKQVAEQCLGDDLARLSRVFGHYRYDSAQTHNLLIQVYEGMSEAIEERKSMG